MLSKMDEKKEFFRQKRKRRSQIATALFSCALAAGAICIFFELAQVSTNVLSRQRRDAASDEFQAQFDKQYPNGNVECMTLINNTYGPNPEETGIYWCDATEFPTDLFTIYQRRTGYVVLHVIGLLYMFIALSIVCDEYFVPALDCISEDLGLSADVAGATFMAAGGSAPELFTAVIGVFIADSDVGIGTIVGSAVFNILFVLGMCAFVVGSVIDPKTNKPTILSLTWWPLARDSLFYIVSLSVLIWVFNENIVEWWESCILLGVYFSYVGFMMFNEKLQKRFVSQKPEETDAEEQVAMKPKISGAEPSKAKGMWLSATTKAKELSGKDFSVGLTNVIYGSNTVNYALNRMLLLRKNTQSRNEQNDDDDINRQGSPLKLDLPSFSDGAVKCLLGYSLLPLIIPLKLTVPDVRYAHIKNSCNGKIYTMAFVMSIVWIAVFSWIMVWMATRIGETFNIPAAIMGLTILAAGTSVPDLLTSVIVAKKGHGDMAVSSSIGSNIFDVTVGLPLPWFLYSLFNDMSGKSVSSEGLVCNIGLLLLMLVVLIGTICACGWKMNKTMGLAMVFLYGGFVAVSLCLSYGIFTCPL